MKSFRRIVGLSLLLVAVTSSTVAGALMVNHTAQPARCHEHGKKVPAPQHTDYACCIAGHGAAAVQASDVRGTPLQATVITAPMAAPQGVAIHRNEKVSAPSSASPPILVSLRI